jgi:hypothetical protein
MSKYEPEISDKIHKAYRKGESFIMNCQKTKENQNWEKKCEYMKKRAIEMNKKHYFKSRIVYTQYDNTSYALGYSGCDLNFDRSLFGNLIHRFKFIKHNLFV